MSELTIAVKELDPKARQSRWGHLSLCILDATYSIGLDYDSVVVPLVHRYANYAQLTSVLLRGEELCKPISPRADEQTLSSFLASISGLTDEAVATKVLGSKTRTSTRNGILKSEAVRRIAQTLVGQGIETLSDVTNMLSDLDRVKVVEKELNTIKGSGQHDIRVGYIWMTAGDDRHVKPDRHVLKWLTKTLGRRVTVAEARNQLIDAADELGLTPWEVDHAIWKYMARGPEQG